MSQAWKLHACWAALVLTFAVIAVNSLTAVQAESKGHVYELRTYVPAEGKMEALNARFRDHTVALFAKHGMRSVGYWTPADTAKDGEALIYLLEHESQEAAQESWDAFRKDPDWLKAKADSEVNGKLTEKVESKFLTPTDYSILK